MPNPSTTALWARPNEALGRYIADEASKTLDAYRAQPNFVAADANAESDTAQGYAHRQLFELVQNSADALIQGARYQTTKTGPCEQGDGRISIYLTENRLYCADNGEPINKEGVKALMFSRLSPKRGTNQIGTFGLGFKSVLGVSNAPEFFSRSGSFRFDRDRSRERILEVVQNAGDCPVLRLPEPLEPDSHRDADDVLREFMTWATNIVRLPLNPGAYDDLCRQIHDFPPEFLLFVEHVRTLTLTTPSASIDRTMHLKKIGDEYHLADKGTTGRWKRFECMHRLSENAQADRRPGDERTEVPIWWAAPLERLDKPGKFWAFFPTHTASLVAGILNAPWKTNEDRQNLLPGPYNKELIEAAARMIADSLPELATPDDPACHLDALPRRHEAVDPDQADLLRNHLFAHLNGRKIVPDQEGALRVCKDIWYPPEDLTKDKIDTKLFEQWATYPGRPINWLHHKALTRNRLAAIDRLFQSQSGCSPGAPRSTIAKWLEALCKNKNEADLVEASKAAVQVAACIQPEIRNSSGKLGAIVLTESNTLQHPDADRLFLSSEMPIDDNFEKSGCIHSALVEDPETLEALKKLGIKPPSAEGNFRFIVNNVLQHRSRQQDNLFEKFWIASRKLPVDDAFGIIDEFNDWSIHILVRTRSNEWKPPHSALLPGKIVHNDGSRDDDAAINMKFHKDDSELLRKLGAVDAPENARDLSREPYLQAYANDCERKWRTLHPSEAGSTRGGSLVFQSYEGIGPLHILEILSDEGKAAYTNALLNQEATYKKWTMWHKYKKDNYPKESFDSPAIWMLRKHGRLNASGKIVPLADALGSHPKNQAALHVLVRHPKAEKIKSAFDLADPTPEPFGEYDDPVPLTDIWPGLKEHLLPHQKNCCLIRCDRILVAGQEKDCIVHNSDLYLADSASINEEDKLRLITVELELDLELDQRNAILQRKTPPEIEGRRAAIRQCSTDAERLLEAAGEQALRRGLPKSLLDVLKNEGPALTGVEIAEAAIATYHTDALRQYRQALGQLDPPKKWAGLNPAVRFVRSLGFSEEWAGERNKKRASFLEVEGPYSLPPLHDYQRTIAGNVRELLREKDENSNERRGMISMPTGSGKTRVAVQAIVESISQDGFQGGVLWIADRDELCEQAVEAWRQVWSSEGAESSRLRISRMWGGQPSPQPTSDLHVVVATLQTLNAKFSNRRNGYEFLANFKLVVFDEAHRSIAPTATSVMQEIGLTRRQRNDEPFLIGLTATPYIGRNEEETAWLANRYGRKRLDAGAFSSDDPQKMVKELQDTGVLAQADHKTIDGGKFRLNHEDLQEIEKFMHRSDEVQNLLAWLPRSVEDRIASNSERTKRIIRAYEKHIKPEWPALVFATSVEHAKTVAALLNRTGIKSRAVSGNTETATRRRVVEEFRNGDIKALVNYGVFREGFDAPRTRAIIVARPVYSPNLYFQMIGRGLRGPQNGGSDRCLILNVHDNIANFYRALAFNDLEWLWA